MFISSLFEHLIGDKVMNLLEKLKNKRCIHKPALHTTNHKKYQPIIIDL